MLRVPESKDRILLPTLTVGSVGLFPDLRFTLTRLAVKVDPRFEVGRVGLIVRVGGSTHERMPGSFNSWGAGQMLPSRYELRFQGLGFRL